MPGNFFDTNILLYLASGDVKKADAADRALALGGTISVQVLNEFAHVATRKMAFSGQEVQSFLKTIRGMLDVIPLTVDIHDMGLVLAERFKLSIYDAMIVSAAISADSDILFTEDLQHGMKIGDLLIVNPLQQDP